ncbi:MAG TPA: shikimate kinase [Pedobacter sp.]|nr:shikimate kinase [Pedobacter sp.]
MKVFLIGFMGCGKSTMGRKLARKLDYVFIDLDHEVEGAAGMSVGDYFTANGEDAFRQLESRTLKEFSYPVNCIVATGGGAPCFFDNMDWMNSNGLAIYIHMTPQALAKRLENGKEKRPLLRGLDEAGMVAFITAKLAERSLFYNQASRTVEGVSLTTDTLIELLASQD